MSSALSHAWGTKESDGLGHNRVIALNFTLPYNQDPPAGFCEQLLVSKISIDIVDKFFPPERLTCLRDISFPTTVSVPEAAVDKNHSAPPCKHQIRAAGQLPNMLPKAITHCVERTTDKQLGLSVNTANTAHLSAPLRRCHYVRHPNRPRVFSALDPVLLVLIYRCYLLSVEEPRPSERWPRPGRATWPL